MPPGPAADPAAEQPLLSVVFYRSAFRLPKGCLHVDLESYLPHRLPAPRARFAQRIAYGRESRQTRPHRIRRAPAATALDLASGSVSRCTVAQGAPTNGPNATAPPCHTMRGANTTVGGPLVGVPVRRTRAPGLNRIGQRAMRRAK